jgi:hypothetical protein
MSAHQLANDYVELASNILLYPTPGGGGDPNNNNNRPLGPFGYDASQGGYPLECVTALQYIKSPLRRRTVLEQWSPYEIAVFEASVALYGKQFAKIQREINTSKTVKDVINFYYIWKKTSHYDKWKKDYVPPYLDVSDEEEEEEAVIKVGKGK